MQLSSQQMGPLAGGEARVSVFAGRAWLGWLVALLLMLPAGLPYLYHFTHVPEGRVATGYLTTDFPYYLGNARAHFEDGFSLAYSLRYSPDAEAVKVYFQPQTLFLGLLWKMTGERLIAGYLLFWFIGAMVFSRVAVALYERVVGLTSGAHWVGLVMFYWGGGLFFVAGLARAMVMGEGLDDLWHFDPASGWWFICMGRNLIIPHETYIHALFFGTVLLLMDRKWGWAMLAALGASWSHPFSGLQLLLVVCAWVFVERVVAREKEPLWKKVWPAPVLLAVHLGYHKLLLPWLSLDHAAIMKQWSVAWTYSFVSQALGYALVLGLIAGTVVWVRPWREMIKDPAQRLLMVWFVVTLGLVNHDLFIKPIQPVHFTRGYDWTPLFLLGAPAMVAGMGWLLKRERRGWGVPAAGALCLLFTLDNVAWLADSWTHGLIGRKEYPLKQSMYKTPAMNELIARMKEPDAQGSLFINLDMGSPLGYLVACETYLRVWTSHPHCTPFYDARDSMAHVFYEQGKYPEEWDQRRLLIAFGPRDRDVFPGFLRGMGAELFYRNEGYTVFVVERRK